MIRGTTAQFNFKLPYKKSDLVWATIKFWQPGHSGVLGEPWPIKRTLDDCSGTDGDSYELRVSLSANETLRFSSEFKAKVQLRAQNKDGVVFASREQSIAVYPINKDIVTDDDPILPEANNGGWVVLDGESIGGDDL